MFTLSFSHNKHLLNICERKAFVKKNLYDLSITQYVLVSTANNYRKKKTFLSVFCGSDV